mgnify:CR=1 FL=1
MIDFLTIILLIFGVLQIILFFKVWEMTNAIKEIRNKYLKDEDEKRRQKAEYDPTPKISGGVKTTIYRNYSRLFLSLFASCANVVQIV